MSSEQIKKLVDNIRPIGQRSPVDRPPPLIRFEFPRKILLFTPIKSPEYVDRIARIVLSYAAEEGERSLLREMAIVKDNLVATGADPVAISCEVRKLEAAIRTQMWHIVMDAGASK